MTVRFVFQVLPRSHETPFRVALRGRNAWAMIELLKAGCMGCTSITHPAPRWSAYVHNLRKLGITIETIHERHEGEFAGTHARYILRDDVREIGQMA